MGTHIRVLFVGDDRGGKEGVAAWLEHEGDGFAVTVAETASGGEACLRTQSFDCVVSEYALPDRDGIEFLESVRESYPDLPFVLYPDEGSEDIAAAAVSASASEYLPRNGPSDSGADLADAVRDAVDDAGATSPTGDLHRVQQIMKAVPGCVVELDRDGQFVYANRRAEEVLGLEQADVTGRAYNDPAWEIRDLQGEPLPDDQLPFRQVVDTGEPLDGYRHSIRWPDGSEVVLSVSGVPLFDDGGAVESVVFSLTDITEQRERERELGRYRQIVRHLDDIATVIAPDGTITYVSPSVERVLGYEPEELIGESGFGYQPPETAEAVAETIEDALANPAEPHTVQTKFRKADGSWCWIESTLRSRTGDDLIDGILVSSRDVTERVEQKQRMREQERQLNQLHTATRELLALRDPKEVAAAASRTAVDVLDFPLNGIHFYDEEVGGLKPVAVSERSREVLGEVPVLDEGIAWRAFQTGTEQRTDDIDEGDEPYNDESPIGSEIHIPLGDRGVMIIGSTQRDAFVETDIELARILGSNTEAALERIDKEQQLRAKEDVLQQRNERLEEFASIVSHDLQNPLNVALGRAELLAEEIDSEHLPPIVGALERMEELVSDTLTLARQGRTVVESEPVGLSQLVEECWQAVSTEEATVEVEDDLTFYGDRSRARQVFENLFRNAVEHGGAAVTVRVGTLGDDGIYVEDTGPGVPESEREEAFDAGYTSSVDGTGFGLAIVRRIAEAHGWTVDLVAGTDGGARFEFTGVETVDG